MAADLGVSAGGRIVRAPPSLGTPSAPGRAAPARSATPASCCVLCVVARGVVEVCSVYVHMCRSKCVAVLCALRLRGRGRSRRRAPAGAPPDGRTSSWWRPRVHAPACRHYSQDALETAAGSSRPRSTGSRGGCERPRLRPWRAAARPAETRGPCSRILPQRSLSTSALANCAGRGGSRCPRMQPLRAEATTAVWEGARCGRRVGLGLRAGGNAGR